jgi:hypothetical protein
MGSSSHARFDLFALLLSCLCHIKPVYDDSFAHHVSLLLHKNPEMPDELFTDEFASNQSPIAIRRLNGDPVELLNA